MRSSRYFLSGDIYRKSCYTCQYANTNRPGDFTLGDYWGVEALRLPLDTADGCSLLMVNTKKAESLRSWQEQDRWDWALLLMRCTEMYVRQ